MTNKTDQLFSTPLTTTAFSFDQRVAEVFPDMIKRSVPGYCQILNAIEQFARDYVTDDSNCYDLGCSLGAASLAMSSGIQSKNNNIIAVDNSQAMLTKCQQQITAFKHQTPIELVESDIQKVTIKNASMVVLNFTLQFIAKEERLTTLNQIYQGMNQGGILVLSEKLRFDDPVINELMIKLHHDFKKQQGYSQLEISQKRNALENVLIPETKTEHIERLEKIGFRHVACWLQEYNFASLIAIK
jgi:tRNA (cmo5U34)-methyltransferase